MKESIVFYHHSNHSLSTTGHRPVYYMFNTFSIAVKCFTPISCYTISYYQFINHSVLLCMSY